MVFHPFGNETTLPPAGWHPEPKVRGSFSVLSTSLLTLFLCVYTVIHTNVPEHEPDRKHGKSWSKLPKWAQSALAPAIWRKIGWMVMGILAPELVAWNAFEQRKKVKATTKEVREYFGDEWTDVHSWFAVMGGFAFDISNAPEPFFPERRSRLIVNEDGVKTIAERWPHLLEQRSLTREQIYARSRADGLSKFLACWQAIWFCTQSIYRLSSGLAITLLELNVFAHAICALLIYLLWWDKPQDVTEPYLMATNDYFDAAATLCTSSYDLSYERLPTLGGENVSVGAFGDLERCEPDETTFHLCGPAPFAIPIANAASGWRSNPYLSFKVGDVCWQIAKLDRRWHSVYKKSRKLVTIDEKALARLKYSGDSEDRPLHSLFGTFLNRRCRDWALDPDDLDFSLTSLRRPLMYASSVTLAGAIYGGLHLTAFNADFSSAVEKLFWRCSSLTITVAGPIFVLSFNVLGWLLGVKGIVAKTAGNTGLIVLTLMAVWYLFCRTFLVVECFISMAYLSPSHLAIPTWSLYIPHLT